MELSKKNTILFPPDLHQALTRRGEREGTSLGVLVRRACRMEYGSTSPEERRRALDRAWCRAWCQANGGLALQSATISP